MVEVERIPVEVRHAIPTALLFPLLGAVVMLFAQALEVTVPEHVAVTPVRDDMVSNRCGGRQASGEAVCTERFGSKLERPSSAPCGGLV